MCLPLSRVNVGHYVAAAVVVRSAVRLSIVLGVYVGVLCLSEYCTWWRVECVKRQCVACTLERVPGCACGRAAGVFQNSD